MRVPHTVPVSTLVVYAASDQTLGLKHERYRTIRSEDLTWDDVVPMSLVYICVRALANHFIEHGSLAAFLPKQDFDYLLEYLSDELPLEIVAPRVRDGIYWQRCSMARWQYQPLDISRHHDSWKQLYIERHCQEYIEEQEPGYIDYDDVKNLMMICSPYVNRLIIKELKPPRKWGPAPNLPDPCTRGKIDPDHMDLSPVLENLINLTDFSVRYSVRKCGMKYNPECFRVSVTDVINLGEGMKRMRLLNSFRLHRCALDDAKVNYIIEAAEYCPRLETLELSHCKFGDIAAHALGKLFTLHAALINVSIQNNKITKVGMRGLAYGLGHAQCCPIRYLNLEFNDIGDKGVAYLSNAVAQNRTLKELRLGSVGMTSTGAVKICQSLLFSNCMQNLSIANNHLNSNASQSIINAVQQNKRIRNLDIRRCGVGEETEIAVQKYLVRNRRYFRLI